MKFSGNGLCYIIKYIILLSSLYLTLLDSILLYSDANLKAS